MARSWLRQRELRQELSPATVARYRRSLESFIEHIGEGVALAAIRRQDFEEWLADARPYHGSRRRYRGSSLNTIGSPVRTFFAWAWRVGMIPNDPTTEVGKATVPQRPPKRLNRESVSRIIDAAPFMERTWIILLAGLGLRLGELAALRVEDYDTEHRLLTVTGKGSKTRILPVHGEVQEALDGWVRYGVRNATGPMWPSPKNPGEGLGRSWIGTRISTVGEAAGVPCHPHLFRHTCASDLVEEGVDLASVQAILGHASLTSTSVYVSSSPEHLRRIMVERRRPYVSDSGAER